MKLLRIQASGFPLFKNKLDICFYAQQRVRPENLENLHYLFPKIYTNSATAITGINASGKTSILRIIGLSLAVLSNRPINSTHHQILDNVEKATLTICFYSNSGNICQLQSTIVPKNSESGERHYIFSEEQLWEKKANCNRKDLTNFDKIAIYDERDPNEVFLPDDVSFIISHNKKENDRIHFVDLVDMTNHNFMMPKNFFKATLPEALRFLDPTIEYLTIRSESSDTPIISLKFYEKEEIRLRSEDELAMYLSSGTIKGITLFLFVELTLRSEGYLLVDEIENHFNREIVATILRLFMNENFNQNGGSIIFSTHYPELLDEFHRNDSIYIAKNKGSQGIIAENLNDILKRNDIKKSEAYHSDLLNGTAPSYDAYNLLKQGLRKRITMEV